MYTPARVWSQQNQDSPFRVGVLHILVGHSGPETAADGRTHFGITSGLEPDVIAEAHLDAASILAGIQRFGPEPDSRLARQRDLLAALG